MQIAQFQTLHGAVPMVSIIVSPLSYFHILLYLGCSANANLVKHTIYKFHPVIAPKKSLHERRPSVYGEIEKILRV